MVKTIVTKKFIDRDTKELQTVGMEYECDERRAELLRNAGYVKFPDAEPEAPEAEGETGVPAAPKVAKPRKGKQK